jgi:hypothetical protein
MLGQDDYGWKVVNYLFISLFIFILFYLIEAVQEVDHVIKDVDRDHDHVHVVFISQDFLLNFYFVVSKIVIVVEVHHQVIVNVHVVQVRKKIKILNVKMNDQNLKHLHVLDHVQHQENNHRIINKVDPVGRVLMLTHLQLVQLMKTMFMSK